jgi:hypothetical protein
MMCSLRAKTPVDASTDLKYRADSEYLLASSNV